MHVELAESLIQHEQILFKDYNLQYYCSKIVLHDSITVLLQATVGGTFYMKIVKFFCQYLCDHSNEPLNFNGYVWGHIRALFGSLIE